MEENVRRPTPVGSATAGMATVLQTSAVIAVVDDDAAARISLVRLLQLEGYDVRGFDSANALIEAPDVGEYSCIVTDLRMPGLTGRDLQRALDLRGAYVPLRVVTAFGTVPVRVEAVRGGAVDFLEAGRSDSVARRGAAGRGALCGTRDPAECGGRRAAAGGAFTAREREVFEGVARGLPNKSIATELGIALKTVKVHRGRVMAKMGAESVADLVRAKEILGGT